MTVSVRLKPPLMKRLLLRVSPRLGVCWGALCLACSLSLAPQAAGASIDIHTQIESLWIFDNPAESQHRVVARRDEALEILHRERGEMQRSAHYAQKLAGLRNQKPK
jgi:hypothetical protein